MREEESKFFDVWKEKNKRRKDNSFSKQEILNVYLCKWNKFKVERKKDKENNKKSKMSNWLILGSVFACKW